MLSVREDTNDEQLRSLWSHPWPRVTRLEADCLWIEDTAAHAISTQAPALRELRMTYPTFISPEGLSMILEAHLAQLHELHLVGPGVDLASIWQSSWPQPLALRDVMLSVAHVSAEILTSVLASAKLTGLDLDAAMLDDPVAIWDDILEHRAKLEAIGLANITMLDDAAVDKVLALWKDSLRWIDLEKTHVSPAKIAEIAATYENIDVGTGEADQLDNDDDDYEDFSD
ncbi:hypothetical protein EC988_008821 [Linderina pennispora]|nr:hypothetical protein EC988_008821 [Linderina pennispora]